MLKVSPKYLVIVLAFALKSAYAVSSPPPVPLLAWMPTNYAVGDSVSVTWDAWWVNQGQSPDSWYATIDGVVTAARSDFVVASVGKDGPWRGQISLTSLVAGSHTLSVSSCNSAGCVTSAPVTITVAASTPAPLPSPSPSPAPAPEPSGVPEAPIIAWMPSQVATGTSVSVAWSIWWTTLSKAPSSWRLTVDGTVAQTSTAFSASSPADAGPWGGSVQVAPLAAGQHSFVVSVCNAVGCTNSSAVQITVGAAAPSPSPSPVPSPSPSPSPAAPGAEPTSIAGSVKANQSGRVFVGYYPTWSDNWFASEDYRGQPLSDDGILIGSKFARVPGTYTHLIAAFATPNFQWSGDMDAWTNSGLEFNNPPAKIKRAIDVLHQRGIKVLVAVGGATAGASDWSALSVEGNSGVNGPITQNLAKVLTSLGFDGLDVDFEVDGTDQATIALYTGAVKAMRNAVNLAGGGRLLALASWSTGADCTVQTSAALCDNKLSYWGGSAGRERLTFGTPDMANMIDVVSVMSYDARYEHYDAPTAWVLYRDLFPAKTIVNIGLETAPEGWAGGLLVVNDADAQCTGSVILLDQFDNSINKAYSVDRLLRAVLQSTSPNKNARDGAMVWQIMKTATGACGSAALASPGTIASKISAVYGLPLDSRDAWK